jgi:mannose-1-phosphate guanylyltransferase/mannose-6-phosphate isomerase
MKYLILAGGSGTRLWPLSRKYFAKQFLNLTGKNTLLQDTALRVSKESGRDIYVITNGESKFIVSDQITDVLPGFSDENLIIEPVGRNTAPAIAYGMLFFKPDDIITVLSSDHYIKNTSAFNRVLEEAGRIAEKNMIVTLGIIPDSPKTGYGYIKRSAEKIGAGFKVERFVEKPSMEKAGEYLADGNYFWNAGIFIFKASVLLEEMKTHSPTVYAVYEKLKKITLKKSITKGDFIEFPEISIDYAVMEKSKLLTVIPSDIGWSDIGSFQSLNEILPKDSDNNSVETPEDFISIDSKNLLVFGRERKIAAINISDLVIIDTPDALLISDNAKTENVKDAVKALQNRKAYETDVHTTVYRPWGHYTILETGKNYRVNRLHINPGKKISFQFHKRRSETWTVVEGKADIIKDNEFLTLNTSESVFMPHGTRHQIGNPLPEGHLVIIEVQIGDYLDEDDIIRLEENH